MSPNPTDGREYKMALARTRQAVAVHKAMQFNAQGSPARCAWPLLPSKSCSLTATRCHNTRTGMLPVWTRRLPDEYSLSDCRAMVELRRALQENSTVREPLLNARYEKEEVSALSCFISAHVLSRPAVSTGVFMDADPAAVASRMFQSFQTSAGMSWQQLVQACACAHRR